MNRKRSENRGLPRRVYVKFGAYRYLSPVKMRDPADGVEKYWIRLADLADGEAAMLTALGKLLSDKELDTGMMPHLCVQYRANKLGKYGAETRAQYTQYLSVIADDFEEFRVRDVTTKDWSDFLRNNYAGHANTARKITSLGRRLFRYAISELGLRQDNPIDQIDLGDYETRVRKIIPTHAQLAAIRAAGAIGKDGRKTASGPMFACIVDMTYLCWARAIDVRTMQESQLVLHEGALVGGRIKLRPSKTRKSSGLAVELVITPNIAAVIERARAIKAEKGVDGPYLFPTTSGKGRGKPYAKSGLGSMWDRARERARIADEIQFKDLRARGATDAAKGGADKGKIKERLVHTSEDTTDIYIKEAIPTLSEIDLPLPWKSI